MRKRTVKWVQQIEFCFGGAACDVIAAMFWLLLLTNFAFAAEPEETVRLRALVASTPRLPYRLTEFQLKPLVEVEMVSSAAVAADGTFYILQRGAKADPVIVAAPDGKVLRTWGKGLYTIPHSIRIDPQGNVWTVDAGDSTIRKFTTDGRELMKMKVEEPPKPKGPFHGTTDIAFAPNGHLYVSDGYQNTRVIEFTKEGRRVREWGTPGTGAGQFQVPHGIAVDRNGVVYVADRENGRIQWFTPEGKPLGMWSVHGKTFCLKITPGGDLWIGTQPRNVPNGAEGWLMKLDPKTGKVLGLLESFGHSVDVAPGGEVLTGKRPGTLLVYRP